MRHAKFRAWRIELEVMHEHIAKKLAWPGDSEPDIREALRTVERALIAAAKQIRAREV